MKTWIALAMEVLNVLRQSIEITIDPEIEAVPGAYFYVLDKKGIKRGIVQVDKVDETIWATLKMGKADMEGRSAT